MCFLSTTFPNVPAPPPPPPILFDQSLTTSAFNPCPSLTSVPRCKRRQESVSLPKNYKTGPLFLDAKKSLSFFEREQIT